MTIPSHHVVNQYRNGKIHTLNPSCRLRHISLGAFANCIGLLEWQRPRDLTLVLITLLVT